MTSPSTNSVARAYRACQRALGRFFDRIWVEVMIGGLIVISVALTLIEFLSPPVDDPSHWLHHVVRANYAITIMFAVELSLRFIAARSKRRFFREFWLDLIALMPLFRPFRAARAARLLRMVTLLRLMGLAPRLASRFPYILRRGALEYLTACAILLVTVFFGAAGMVHFEGAEEGGITPSLVDAFWFSLYSLFSGEPVPAPPTTLGGKIVAAAVMFMGLTIFAMITGTVSAFMVERVNAESRTMNFDDLEDHIIICGWNSRGEIVVREFCQSSHYRDLSIVVVADHDQADPLIPPDIAPHVRYLNADFTRVSALEMVGVQRARLCVILADVRGDRSEQDADARTVLGALTVEKLRPSVYTCAELHDRAHGDHLKLGHVDDFIVSGEYGAYLLAHAAMKRGLVRVCTELLTNQHGNEFHRVSLPEDMLGRSFFDIYVELKRDHNAILVAVDTPEGRTLLNPGDYTFQPGDELVVISASNFQL